MKIRRATIKNIPEIDKLYVEGVIDEVKTQFQNKSKKEILKDLNKYEKERLKGFKKNIKSNLSLIIVVIDKNKLIGFGEAIINKDEKNKSEITKIYLAKNYRKKSIGSKIMKRLIKWLKIKKVTYVSAGILINNKASIKLSEKAGFKKTALRMQRRLK